MQYGYTNRNASYLRRIHTVYPDGTILSYNYGSSSGANDVLNRVQRLNQGGITLVDYSFLGQDRFVIANYTGQPGVELTYFTSGGSGEGGDHYTGLDRFGRIIDQRWRRTSNNADVERVKYGYDRGSSRTWRQNTVAGTGQDEFYTYDGLQQVKTLDRGTLNAGKTGISGTPQSGGA
jgi:hypothetical protein